MQDLSDDGRRIAEDTAAKHGVSFETATLLMSALAAGGGTQAQFDIRELGGMGQWSRGGMTMVGDMFNTGLKAKVDALCSDLSGLMASARVYASSRQAQNEDHAANAGGGSGNWWPEGLGRASSTGSQNDMRYAVFPETRRLAVDQNGRVTVYDTGDHRIGGVSQQQGAGQSLRFTSQNGQVSAADLAVVSGDDDAKPREPEAKAGPAPEDDVFAKIERLAELNRNGALSDDEFGAKKAELMARI